ncbi:hypothetical protein T439DRAFT_50176 [Meredithblackwellia eburnea MCA 4105]
MARFDLYSFLLHPDSHWSTTWTPAHLQHQQLHPPVKMVHLIPQHSLSPLQGMPLLPARRRCQFQTWFTILGQQQPQLFKSSTNPYLSPTTSININSPCSPTRSSKPALLITFLVQSESSQTETLPPFVLSPPYLPFSSLLSIISHDQYNLHRQTHGVM